MCLNFGLHVNLWNLLLWSQVGIESPLLLEVLFGFSSRGIFLLDYLWLNKNVFQMVSSLSLNHMIPVTFSVLDTPQINNLFYVDQMCRTSRVATPLYILLNFYFPNNIYLILSDG